MTATERGLDEVLDRVRDRTGLDTGRYSRPYLRRRVLSRLRTTDCDDYFEYADLLKEGDEHSNLLSALWVNVTEFFRNEDVWRFLHDALEDGTTALSAGCSDGREAYSLSMLSLAKGIEATVEGVDIDAGAVEKAREARYDDADREKIRSLEFLDSPSEYLRETEDGYEVREEVSERVGFHRSDVTDIPSTLSFDLVLCRNLLIYVDEDKKGSVIDSLSDVLTEGGYLVLGKTERLHPDYADCFEAIDSRLRVYRYEG